MNTLFINFISRHALQVLLLALSCITFDVLSQPNWPIKPITIIVPYAPGGGHDSMARILAERLTSRLGQSVIVDNKAGANGMIGAEYVAKALPDGYTVLFASPAEIVISPIAYKSMRYDPAKDLLPVTLAGLTPLVVVAHPGTGLKTISELVTLAKAQPNKLSYGTSGNASSQHLAGALLNNMASINLQHIPYKGAGPATNDVLSGQIPIAIVGMAPVLSHIRAGKLIPLAVTQQERAESAKDIPTVSETQGLNGFEATHWMGVFLPARAPLDVLHRLQSEIATVLKLPEIRARLIGLGIEPIGNTPLEFRNFLIADQARFAKMFRIAGLTPE